MRLRTLATACLSWLAPTLLAAQPRPGPDCRLRPADIRPVLGPTTPGLASYRYDAAQFTEVAELGGGRTLVIRQSGCLRHHIDIQLTAPAALAPAAPQWTAAQFRQQVLALLDAVFTTDLAYAEYRSELAGWLTRAWPDGNWRRAVTVPVADRSFFVQGAASPEGILLHVQVVRLLPSAPLKHPGIPPAMDDGWQPPRDRP